MSLSAQQRWLLELVVELRHPIALLSNPDLDEALNRSCPRLSPEQWSDLIDGLLRDALIDLRLSGGAPVAFSREELLSRLSASEHGPPSERSIYYGLTPQGGAAWESFARPDWNRYLDRSAGETEVEVVCADPDRLERFARAPWQEWRCIGHERRDVLSPWPATYWGKTLPVGHRLRYSYRDREEPRWTTEEYAQRNAWLADMNTWFERVVL